MFDKIKEILGANEVESDREVDINGLVKIPGYDAGKHGCLLVAEDDDLIIAHLERTKGLIFQKKDITVHPMICTAFITNKEDQKVLAQYCDHETDYDKVIIVNSKFMSFWTPNYIKRTLLEAQSAKTTAIDRVNVFEQTTVAEWVAARENHFERTVKKAFKKRDKYLNKQCLKFANAQRRENRKESGNEWDINEVGSFE